MNRSLLDTDILSLLMRHHANVLANAATYLNQFQHLSFSIVTLYEIARGLKAKNANVQLSAFEKFCAINEVVSFSTGVAETASDIYAQLYTSGNLIGDADILIAATAKTTV